jgi:hypothetical protein
MEIHPLDCIFKSNMLEEWKRCVPPPDVGNTLAALYVAESYSTAMRFLTRSYAVSDRMCLCINSVLL